MRTGSSDILFRGHRDRSRPDSRQTKARKSRNYRFDLEGLESAHAAGHDTSPSADELPRWSTCQQPMDNGPGAQEDSPTRGSGSS